VKIDNLVDPKRAAVTAAVMFVLVTSFVMRMSSPLASQGARGIGGIEGNADSAYEIGLWATCRIRRYRRLSVSPTSSPT
jgi:hypothetical protein